MDGWINGWALFLYPTDVIDASEKDDFPTDFAIFKNSRVRLGTGSKKFLLALKQECTPSKIDVNQLTNGLTNQPTKRFIELCAGD